jgi:hypothetical protein
MATELVRYEKDGVTFSKAVADFATSLHPFGAAATFFSKVVASRVETKRLRTADAKNNREHVERMTAMRLQAEVIDGHSRRQHDAAIRKVEADERVQLGSFEKEVRRLELNFDAAMGAIRLDGELRRYEIDRQAFVELQRIDVSLQMDLARLAERRRLTDRSIALMNRSMDQSERSQRAVRATLAQLTKAIGGRDPAFASMAFGALPYVTSSLRLMAKDQVDAPAAILISLSDPDIDF